jgi:hypothetical protein
MSAALARMSVALSGRRLLAPLTLLLFTVIGVYAYRPNLVQESFAATTVLCAAFCAWFVIAVEREVPESADVILTVAAGGAVRAWRGRIVLVALVAAGVTVVFLGWPTLTGAFKRAPGAGDLANAAFAHLAAGVFGGCLALLLAPPSRIATAFAATIVVVLGSVALGSAAKLIAGPGGVAKAMSAAADNHVSARLVATAAITLAEAAALAVGARRLARWRG